MSELINLSLTDQVLGLGDKSFSSKEITGAYLNEIKKKESLNCFISVFEEESEEKALIADENIAKNKARPLEGIPIAHKDICLLYTSPSPRDLSTSRMPSSA